MLEEDDFGLLHPDASSPAISEDERLVSAFAEVTAFVKANGREPERSPTNMSEMQLAMRLKAMREDEAQREALKEHDELDLLQEPEPPESIEEVVASDDLGLLESDDPDLYDLKHVPPKVTTMPEEIGRRTPCLDFDRFRKLFEECKAALASGDRDLLPFKNEQQIDAGRFYVLKGVLLYVDEVGERTREAGKVNARLRCIFDNETESNMLLRSLAAELYKDGRRVTESRRATERITLEPDTPMASVYVLRSLSKDPQLAAFPQVHKIGSTRQTVEDRIAGATGSATFLGAPVEIAAVYKVPEGTEKAFEKQLHSIFAESRLDIWFEQSGKAVASANEWFAVPLDGIEKAFDLIEADSIGNFHWDHPLAEFRPG